MSLLLDALKRAEQEKQMSRSAGRDNGPSREPVITAAAANAPSALPLELQPLHSAQAASPKRSEAAAHAAQAVFQAKQAAAPDKGNGQGIIWATIGIIVVVVSSAGAYVWSQIHTLSPQSPAAYSSKRPMAAPIPEAASAAPHVEAPLPAALSVLPPPAAGAPAERPAESTAPRDALVKELLAPATPAPARPPVELMRSTETRHVPAEIGAGYQALRSGDLSAASRQYEAALASDPRSLDALLGLATVEARGGNRPAASGLYRRALEVDPRNPTALAALAALADEGRAGALEPELLADVARYPKQASLHLALGNLYAAQNRWNDAQGAYFEAHRLDPASADIAFNLAVALDQLGKGNLAARFYRRALEAARGQPAQFEPAAAARRAAELEAAPDR